LLNRAEADTFDEAGLSKFRCVAAVPGSQCEFMWGGYGGTYFWVDPKEELAVVMMMQHAGPSRVYYRREIRQLVYQSIVD
jgi:CubicO group peptidase (beta-lactamase class C family)